MLKLRTISGISRNEKDIDFSDRGSYNITICTGSMNRGIGAFALIYAESVFCPVFAPIDYVHRVVCFMESSQIRRPARKYSFTSYFVTALLGALLGGIVVVMVFPQVFSLRALWTSDDTVEIDNTGDDPPRFPLDRPAPRAASPLPLDEINRSRRTAIVMAVERVSPTVVSIVATQLVRQRGYTTLFDDPIFGRFLAVPQDYLKEIPNTGSGVVISPDGYIVTNAHVVQNARRIRIVLADGQTLESSVIGVNERSDLAVLRVQDDVFSAAMLGTSSNVMVGEWAIAIGNPLGLAIDDAKPAVTVGVVSAVGRDFSRSESDSRAVYRDMIQTDASINPGNSGGPLVNALGEVIGINTFIISESGGSEGIGFAIPIDHVKKVADELIKYGKPRSGRTGLSVTDITRFLAAELGIRDRNGVLVNDVASSSPAAQAGVQVMDIIREINGQPIANRAEAREVLYGMLVGDTVQLVIERNGRRMTMAMQIEEGQE